MKNSAAAAAAACTPNFLQNRIISIIINLAEKAGIGLRKGRSRRLCKTAVGPPTRVATSKGRRHPI